MEANKEIDTRGLNCPLPILKAKKALADMASGETLKVVATDPGSLRDFQAFARQTGNELIDQRTVGDEFIHWLRRRWAAPGGRTAVRERGGGATAAAGRAQMSSDFRYSRKLSPTSGCASPSSTLACRKPSLLPQS